MRRLQTGEKLALKEPIGLNKKENKKRKKRKRRWRDRRGLRGGEERPFDLAGCQHTIVTEMKVD